MDPDEEELLRRQRWLREFEAVGEHALRIQVAMGALAGSEPGRLAEAIRWLADRDQQRSDRSERSSSEQRRLALEANQIARQAKTAAIAAAALAAIGMIISVLAWLFPHV